MKPRFLTPDTPPAGGVSYLHVRLPNSAQFKETLVGALAPLTQAENWQVFGTMTADEAAEYWSTILSELTDTTVLPVGTLICGYWATPQANWLACDGSLQNQADWPELMAVYPDEMKTGSQFVTPNLIGRVPLGRGIADFTHIFAYGDTGGEYEHTLTLDEIPAHTHTYTAAASVLINGGLEAPAASATPAPGGLTGTVGGGFAHNNVQPYCVAQFYLVGRLLP